MPFPKKDWKDGAAGGTKLNAAALEDMEERLSGYTDTELTSHAADTTSVHGIADTSALALKSEVATDAELAAHEADTTSVHGISNTANLATKSFVETEAGLLIPKSLVDAKGDLLVGTADNTVARKAVGGDGSALLADSAEGDGLRWGTPKGVTIACRLCAVSALPANTRTGGKMEANANGALGNIDGVAPAVGDYVLTPSESTGSNRAVYKITNLGSAGSKWVMERPPEFDASEEVRPGMLITVAEGTICADSTWQLTADGPITLGTTSLTFLPVRGPAIGCSARLTGSQAIPNNEGTKINWSDCGGAIGYNVGPCWSEANKSRLVAPLPGLYAIACTLEYDDENVQTGERSMYFIVNGGTKNCILQLQHNFSGQNGRALSASTFFRATTAADYLEVGCFQDSGSARKIEADEYGTGFQVARVTFERIR